MLALPRPDAAVCMIIPAPLTRKGWLRRTWFVTMRALRRVAYLEDTPHRIALGSAAGILSSTLPIIGQTFLAMILARIARGNVLASIPWSWISNPLTTLPLWYAGYRIGLWFIPGPQQVLSYADLRELGQRVLDSSWSGAFTAMASTLGGILGPLWIGCTVLGLAMAVPGYFLVHSMVVARQARRAARQAAWRP